MKYIFVALAVLITSACSKDDDNFPFSDLEESFTATIDGSIDPTFTFEATREGITDYITARTQGGSNGMSLSVKATNFDQYMDIQFQIDNYTGSGTYLAGDSGDNSNWIRYGKGRVQQAWWISNAQYHERVSTAMIVINDGPEFLTGSVSFQGFRQQTLVQVDGTFKIRKDN